MILRYELVSFGDQFGDLNSKITESLLSISLVLNELTIGLFDGFFEINLSLEQVLLVSFNARVNYDKTLNLIFLVIFLISHVVNHLILTYNCLYFVKEVFIFFQSF